MRKIKLYVETSPIIMIAGSDQDPIRQAITKEFFRIVAEKSDEYELLISPVTIEELNAGDPDQRSASELFLTTFDYTELSYSDESENLAWIYAGEGVLSQSHINDLRHAAYAVVLRCDYVVTWNMRHLANDRTENRIKRINALENYSPISLITPEHFTQGAVYE